MRFKDTIEITKTEADEILAKPHIILLKYWPYVDGGDRWYGTVNPNESHDVIWHSWRSNSDKYYRYIYEEETKMTNEEMIKSLVDQGYVVNEPPIIALETIEFIDEPARQLAITPYTNGNVTIYVYYDDVESAINLTKEEFAKFKVVLSQL